MNRTRLIKHLKAHGCRFVREGKKHSLWVSPAAEHPIAVPRHRQIKLRTALGICQQLGVPEPIGDK